MAAGAVAWMAWTGRILGVVVGLLGVLMEEEEERWAKDVRWTWREAGAGCKGVGREGSECRM